MQSLTTVHGQVVPEGSARLGQRNERTVGLGADYRQICKFEKETDANYRRVLGRLEAIIIVIRERLKDEG